MKGESLRTGIGLVLAIIIGLVLAKISFNFKPVETTSLSNRVDRLERIILQNTNVITNFSGITGFK